MVIPGGARTRAACPVTQRMPDELFDTECVDFLEGVLTNVWCQREPSVTFCRLDTRQQQSEIVLDSNLLHTVTDSGRFSYDY